MILVSSFVAIFVGFYLSYYAICWFYIRKKNLTIQADSNNSLLKVSIIVPVFNEVNVLEDRIENFNELNYPKDKLELVFVDGGSTDGSIQLLKDLTKQSNYLLRPSFKVRGKVSTAQLEKVLL